LIGISVPRIRENVMLVPLALAAAVLAIGYVAVVRPWALNWGTTSEERAQSLPGDDLIPDARYVTTRALTVNAPPSAVWPWLVQMGQDRAGFYTHNWVERLLRSGIPDTHELHPEWQRLEVGDLIRTNHDVRGKAMGWPVAIVDPEHALVVRSRNMLLGTYAFVLQPLQGGRTRLIVRDRAMWRRLEIPFAALVYEPLHAYIETGLIRGIRERAANA
jgi:hypothetical protein